MMMWFYGLDAGLSLLLYLWAIPRWGATGAAWVTVFSEVFIAVATAILRSLHGDARRPGCVRADRIA